MSLSSASSVLPPHSCGLWLLSNKSDPPRRAEDPRRWLQREGLWLVTLPNGHGMSQCLSSPGSTLAEAWGEAGASAGSGAAARLHRQPFTPGVVTGGF